MPAAKKTKTSQKKPGRPKKKVEKKEETISEKEEMKAAKKKTTSSKSTSKTKKQSPSTKKSKKVIVDVIEDDNDHGKEELEDYLDPSLPVFEQKNDSFSQIEDLNIDGSEEAKISFSQTNAVINSDDIDSQKKFFNQLKTEVTLKKKAIESEEDLDDEVKDLLDLFEDEDEDEKDHKKTDKDKRRINIYLGFVWKFLVIVLAIGAFVSYFVFSKLTINIVPSYDTLNESLLLKVSSTSSGIRLLSDPRENVAGMTENITVSVNKQFNATGEEYVGEDISGRVKIINNYSRSQPLVSTTRLLTPDNKLFRIKEAVNVPAGGEVWVDIYTERPSREFAVAPTTFTIPGLWVGLQDSIYAKSEEAFVFEQRKDMYVRVSDISLANREILDLLEYELVSEIEKMKTELEKNTGEEFDYVFSQEREAKISFSAKAEDKVSEFDASASADYIVVFFSKTEAERLAYGKLNLLVPSGKELLDFDPSSINYNFESFNDDTATIKSSFSGKMLVKQDNDIINRENITNLKADQISTYLRGQKDIETFSLHFQPSFIKTAPRLVDRIKINIVSDIE